MGNENQPARQHATDIGGNRNQNKPQVKDHRNKNKQDNKPNKADPQKKVVTTKEPNVMNDKVEQETMAGNELKKTTEEPNEPAAATEVDKKNAEGTKEQKEAMEEEEKDNQKSSESSTSSASPDSKPIQIVSIGNETNAYAFSFHEEEFLSILSQIPPGWKISVISVVGAFRTGKSFLLSWFLRYLHHIQTNSKKDEETSDEPPSLVKETDTEEAWYTKFSKLDADSGFHWRGGSERNTTGIWMWSQPFFFDQTAVILVDTQGMFDHDTTMELTAAIFGLSTLLSSYQIYNVDKNIQEDHLQQLALFTEYGRMVVAMDNDEEKKNKLKPFQRMEFLVRDWQHFESDEDGDMEDLEKEMSDYLSEVLSEKSAQDLKDTREQITTCFQDIDCFMLTHPGSAVTRKKYEGDTKQVDPIFLKLLDRFCQKVFSGIHLVPKTIHGRTVTAAEFGVYVKAFAKLFAEGARFPKATTMLEATASANNTNATAESEALYKEKMDSLVGPNATVYVQPEDLQRYHGHATELALECFDRRANFGSSKGIEKSKKYVMKQIKDDWELYSKLNEGRNPLGAFGLLLIPLTVAFVSFLLRYIADSTCSSWSQTCKASSDILAELYTVIFLFVMIVTATKMQQVRELYHNVMKALGILIGGEGSSEASASSQAGKKVVKQD